MAAGAARPLSLRLAILEGLVYLPFRLFSALQVGPRCEE
jgi:hypothetical protein